MAVLFDIKIQNHYIELRDLFPLISDRNWPEIMKMCICMYGYKIL